jgi:coproporphyrinogen III oxidase-like Fe-S oxidoreductase
MNEIFFGGGNNLIIQTSKNVQLRETLVLINGQKEPIELDVKITADFNTIPEKYHEVFLNIMSSKYYNRVSFGDNPFSQCVPPKKKKWYQFWK